MGRPLWHGDELVGDELQPLSTRGRRDEPMCEKSKVVIKGRLAYIVGESGATAFIPVDKLCEVARRFNLCIENFKCD